VLERIGYKNAVALVYTTALFMQVMDSTIINVALPTLAEEFDVDATSMDWTVLSFALALAMMTAAAGWFGDRFGLRPTFLVCLVGFTVASALCGASQSLEQLIAARAIQGGFAGMMIPIGAALVFRAFPLSERAEASRKIITVVVIAPAVGPIVAGILLEFTSWRWIFFVNVPVGIVSLALASAWLRKDEPVDAGPFDVRGFVLSATGLGLLIYGLSRGGERGWGSTPIVLSLVLSLLALVALVFVELGQEQPLLALRLTKDRLFSTINVLAIPIYGGFIALVYLLPIFLQDEAGFSPLRVGLVVVPQPIGVLLMTQFTGRIFYKRFGPRRLLIVGSLIALGSGIVASTFDTTTTLWTVDATMLVRGLAMGLVFIPIQSAVYARIERRDLSRATAIFSTTRQLAPAIGVALGSSILASGFARDVEDSANRVDSYQNAILVTAALFAVAAVIALWIKDEDAAATMAR